MEKKKMNEKSYKIDFTARKCKGVRVLRLVEEHRDLLINGTEYTITTPKSAEALIFDIEKKTGKLKNRKRHTEGKRYQIKREIYPLLIDVLLGKKSVEELPFEVVHVSGKIKKAGNKE